MKKRRRKRRQRILTVVLCLLMVCVLGAIAFFGKKILNGDSTKTQAYQENGYIGQPSGVTSLSVQEESQVSQSGAFPKISQSAGCCFPHEPPKAFSKELQGNLSLPPAISRRSQSAGTGIAEHL